MRHDNSFGKVTCSNSIIHALLLFSGYNYIRKRNLFFFGRQFSIQSIYYYYVYYRGQRPSCLYTDIFPDLLFPLHCPLITESKDIEGSTALSHTLLACVECTLFQMCLNREWGELTVSSGEVQRSDTLFFRHSLFKPMPMEREVLGGEISVSNQLPEIAWTADK